MKCTNLILSSFRAGVKLVKRTSLHPLLGLAVLASLVLAPTRAQFGGRAGDVVFYTVTYNGGGEFQALAPGTANTAAQIASVKITHLADVPFVGSDPFPLKRQVLYMTNSETFQVGTDYENTVGLHRLNVFNVKIMQIEGAINIIGPTVGWSNAFISLPQGLDDQGDLSLEDVVVITWFPGAWPFIVATDKQGPYPCPAGASGFSCFVTIPDAIKLPSLLPWISLKSVYPSGRWQEGIDQKIMFQEPSGVTIRQFRLRPGRQTPLIRTAGHTHLFVLQGAGTVTAAGGATLSMKKYDYTLMPENAAFVIANPKSYEGPGSQPLSQ